MYYLRPIRLLPVILFCLLCVEVAAQELSSEARAHVEKLQSLYVSGGSNINDEAFTTAFLERPKLSYVAFAAALSKAKELFSDDQVEEGRSYLRLANCLAAITEDYLGDNEPIFIIRDLIEDRAAGEKRLDAYLKARAADPASPRPFVVISSTPNYGDAATADALTPELYDIVQPYLVKRIRLDLALGVDNSNQFYAELATLPQVEASMDSALARVNQTAISRQMLAPGLWERLKTQEASMLAATEPPESFPYHGEELVRQTRHPLNAVTVLLWGFQGALRQGRNKDAKTYIAEAREMWQSAAAKDPVLEFSLATAEYQLRRSTGYEPTGPEALRDLHEVWKRLDGYKSYVVIRQDINWHLGRRAAKFWLDELALHPEQTREAFEFVFDAATRWGGRLNGGMKPEYTANSILGNDELYGAAVVTVAQMEVLLYSFEVIWDKAQAEVTVANLRELEAYLPIFDEWGTTLGSGIQGDAFPKMDLGSDGIVPQLRARLALLEGRMSSLSTDQRRDALKRGLGYLKNVRDPEVSTHYLIRAGEDLLELGDEDAADAIWREALALCDRYHLRSEGVRATSLLANLARARNQGEAATAYTESALSKIQPRLTTLDPGSPEGREAKAALANVTEQGVTVRLEGKDAAGAMDFLSRSVQVEAAAAQMKGKPEVRAEMAKLEAQQTQIAIAETEIEQLAAQPSSSAADQLLKAKTERLAANRAQYLSKSREIRQQHADTYSRVLRVDPLNLPELQSTMPKDTAVLQYFSTDEKLFIFVVSAEAFGIQSVDVGRVRLDTMVSNCVRSIRRNGPSDPTAAEECSALYNVLIGPVGEQLEGKSTLVVVPSGRLNAFPFAALVDSAGVPIIETRSVVELAKPTDIARAYSQAPARADKVVAFANPGGDLEQASWEGTQIAKIYPATKIFLGSDATRQNFLKFGSGAEILHVATHGEWNFDDSLASYLTMSGSDKISQEEIFELALDKTALVTLSACNTAMGEGSETGYVASLAEAFWLAGSRSVVASLWAVDDSSTALLMSEFYRRLQAGESKAEALRGAQTSVRKIEKFRAPYYWAGFVLYGDWR